jgi:archaellum biogenesis ATPase FlaH
MSEYTKNNIWVHVLVVGGCMKSDLNALNTVLPSGLVPGIIINILGRYMSGKTLLSLQESFYVCSQEGGNILFLDVDGSINVFLAVWESVFKTRYDANDIKVFVLPSYNVQRFDSRQKLPYFDLPIYKHFGVKAQVNMSHNGKANFTAYAPCENTVETMIEKNKVRCVIVDSFSQIFKDLFVGTESFGERARAEDFLFGLIKASMLNHGDVYWFVNHHNSVNPITSEVRISGGGSVLHNSKVAVYINKPSDRTPEGELYTYRYPNIPPFGRVAKIGYTEAGIVDV